MIQACQHVSGKNRCLSVGDGSNGCGEVESLPVFAGKTIVFEWQFIHILDIYPAHTFLDSGIASSNNQACSEHAYRGGKAAWPVD